MNRKPRETDFEITVSEAEVAVMFWPTRSLYAFSRFTSARDVAEFGPVSPDPVVRHASRSGGTRHFMAAEVQAMAFRLAAAAAARG
jgi:hypothetical protein